MMPTPYYSTSSLSSHNSASATASSVCHPTSSLATSTRCSEKIATPTRSPSSCWGGTGSLWAFRAWFSSFWRWSLMRDHVRVQGQWFYACATIAFILAEETGFISHVIDFSTHFHAWAPLGRFDAQNSMWSELLVYKSCFFLSKYFFDKR